MLALAGYNPFEAYGIILWGIFGKVSYFSYTIVKATPLILTGLSVAFAFRTGLFNIGAEGQFIMGTIVAAVFGSLFSLPFYLQIPLIILLTILITGLFGSVLGFLKARYGVHEVISSIMLNWIALYLRNYFAVVSGWQSPIVSSEDHFRLGERGFSGGSTSVLQGFCGCRRMREYFSLFFDDVFPARNAVCCWRHHFSEKIFCKPKSLSWDKSIQIQLLELSPRKSTSEKCKFENHRRAMKPFSEFFAPEFPQFAPQLDARPQPPAANQ